MTVLTRPIGLAGTAALVLALTACSASVHNPRSSSASDSPSPHGITIFHKGYALPPCNIGVAPAPCQRTVSPVEVSFSTPVAVGVAGQGGYTVDLNNGSIEITAFVDQTPIGSCPAADGAACLSSGQHTLVDDAGTWDIHY